MNYSLSSLWSSLELCPEGTPSVEGLFLTTYPCLVLIWIKYSTEKCTTGQGIAVQERAVHDMAVHKRAVQRRSAEYRAVPDSSVEHRVVYNSAI